MSESKKLSPEDRATDLFEKFDTIRRDSNRRTREMMVEALHMPKGVLSSVEQVTLGLTGSLPLMYEHRILAERIKRHKGQPILSVNAARFKNEHAIGIIRGKVVGKSEPSRGGWGQLVVPASPVSTWSDHDTDRNYPRSDIVVCDIWGIDAETELQTHKATNAIQYEAGSEIRTVLIGYEDIMAWEGLQEYAPKVARFLESR